MQPNSLPMSAGTGPVHFDGFGLTSWTMGAGWSGESEFSCEFPLRVDPQEVVDALRGLVRRDSTSQRAAELAYINAPREGMALALDCTGLWEGHELSQRVYILETGLGSGRCVAMKHLHPPLIDVPLSQFRILADCDV